MKKQQYSGPNRPSLIFGLLLVLTMPFPAMGGEKGQLQKVNMLKHVVLRQNVTVDDHFIILGDIFKGTGNKSNITISKGILISLY